MIGSSLTRRMLGTLLLGLAAVFVSQSLARLHLELPVLFSLEQELDRLEAERARIALRQRLDELITITTDYALWDDSHAFMQSAPGSGVFTAFVESNLVYSTHENNNINGFVFLDRDRQVHHATSWDLESARELSIQPFPITGEAPVVLHRRVIERHEDRDELINAGYQESVIGPILFAAVEIHRSDGSGEPLGTMLTWRRFDEGLIATLREQLQRSISFYPIATARSDPKLSKRLDGLLAMSGPRGPLERDGEGELYWLIRTVQDQPLFLVRQAATERLFNAGWWSPSFLVGFGASALVLLAMGVIFSRWVIRPLDEAGRAIRSISDTGNYATRLARSGHGEISQLVGFINHLLACIQNQENELRAQNRRLEGLTQEDPLTGIANRRHLDARLHGEWQTSLESGTSLGLCLVDIDCFKAFNDNYGHQNGDRVLRRVAETLAAHLHAATDLLARYGGEEFCVVLPETDADAARRVAERLRRAVESLGIVHEHSAAAPVLTVSVGLAAGRAQNGSSVDALLERADSALYTAKRLGRNRVCVAESSASAEAHPTGLESNRP